ncbi:MAG TPA: hypothetical protein VKX17_00025 [Planctomycetota bacterium]|nr:hypothetical protein [Planctomycetota bacterium]
MRTLNSAIALAILFACAAFAPFALRAADLVNKDKESEQAAKEEAAEKDMSEEQQINLTKTIGGTLYLSGDTGGEDDPVGTLLASGGKSYLLKLTDKALMKKLTPLNNKLVTLKGKLRNEEKYLLVSGVVEMTGSSAPDRPKRGGI